MSTSPFTAFFLFPSVYKSTLSLPEYHTPYCDPILFSSPGQHAWESLNVMCARLQREVVCSEKELMFTVGQVGDLSSLLKDHYVKKLQNEVRIPWEISLILESNEDPEAKNTLFCYCLKSWVGNGGAGERAKGWGIAKRRRRSKVLDYVLQYK